MSKKDYSAVLLAAGLSSRMNAWKPGIMLNGAPILFYGLKTLSDICGEVVVVGGYNFNRLKELIGDFSRIFKTKVKLVENKNYKSGMFSSVKTGIENAEGENIFIALPDMPFVKPETYKKLITLREASKDNSAVIYPVNISSNNKNPKRGHPVLINGIVKERILNQKGDAILSNLFHEFNSADCSIDDEWINFDIDTEEDLERAKANLRLI